MDFFIFASICCLQPFAMIDLRALRCTTLGSICVFLHTMYACVLCDFWLHDTFVFHLAVGRCFVSLGIQNVNLMLCLAVYITVASNEAEFPDEMGPVVRVCVQTYGHIINYDWCA